MKAKLPNKTIGYVVDGMGRRVAKKVDGQITNTLVYGQGIQPIAELRGSGGIKSQFVYGSKAHVPDLMIRNGITYRFVTDQVGSVRMVVNSSTGEVAQQIEYDPFGKVLSDTNLVSSLSASRAAFTIPTQISSVSVPAILML